MLFCIPQRQQTCKQSRARSDKFPDIEIVIGVNFCPVDAVGAGGKKNASFFAELICIAHHNFWLTAVELDVSRDTNLSAVQRCLRGAEF